jgi:hypothetical protein
MEENARTLDLRPLLAVAAAVAVGLTLWASGAFAAGGSSSGDSPGGAQSSFIQNGVNDQAPSREDCPKDGGGSGGSGGDSGSDAPSL